MAFTQIPSNLRVPLFYAELDASQASTGGGAKPKSLIIAQKLAAGSAAADLPVQVTSGALAASLFGVGSDAHRMCLAFFRNNPFGELHVIPLADATGTNATVELDVSSAATGDGTIFLYIGGQLVETAVSEGDTDATIATAIAAAITASTLPLPVTASAALATVTLTALHDGTTGNSIDVRANYAGAAGGQEYPASVTLTAGGTDIAVTPAYVGDDTAGATDPALTNAIAAMGDEPFDFIAHSFGHVTAALDALETEMDDRWDALKQVYGACFATVRAGQTGSGLSAYGNARNDPYHHLMGWDEIPTDGPTLAAAYMGAAARELEIDPARPLQTVKLDGILAPRINDAFTAAEQNTLLYDGITVGYRSGSDFRVTRSITTYQKDDADNPDDAFLDTTTVYTLMEILRRLKSAITSKYPRHKLANDGTRFGPGQKIVTPNTLRAELVSEYAAMELDGLVESMDLFKANLVVERDSTDPNRVNVTYPPDLINQLRVFALLAQFRLNYPSAASA
jgi:phage tail sheath gpL-like